MSEDPYGAHAAGVPPSGGTGDSTRSLGDIVGDISRDMSALVRQEMELAKAEIKQEVTKVGKGAGMFGGAGAAGYLCLLFLSFALIWLLDNWLPVELAALIVGVLWGIAGVVLAMRGKQEIQEANPQLPVTQQTVKEDVQWARNQKS